MNAELIRNGISQYDRILTLKQAAVEQVKSLLKSKAIQDTLLDSPNIEKHKRINIKNIDSEKQTPSLKPTINKRDLPLNDEKKHTDDDELF